MSYFQKKLILDFFAGGGGGSTGIERAGLHVDHAFNHAADALGMHRINHPWTQHHQEDVFDAIPDEITQGRPIGLAHFSPDCRHFSKAKGGKPVEKRIRGLVLVMLRWAKAGAEVMTMENVEEIRTWGPLVQMVKNGKPGWYPDPQHIGRTWRAFVDCMTTGIDPDHPDLPEFVEVLAGTVSKEEMIRGFGYDFDAREIRGFSHGAPTIRNRLFGIFRCDGKPIVWPDHTHADPRKLQPGQQKWPIIAQCLDFTLPCHSIFLSGKSAKKARCKRPLARPTLSRVARGIDQFVLKAAQPFIVSLTHQGGDRVESVNEPAKTITGAHRGEKALVQTTTAPFVTEHANASNPRNMPADEPARTICAQVKGGHFALVSANLVHIAHGEHDKNGKKRGRGERSVEMPLSTTTASPDLALVTGTLVQTGYGEREGQAPRALDPQAPLGTVTAGGGKHALAACSLVKMRGDNVGSEADAPLHTISAGGTHHGLVTAFMAQHNGGFCDTPGHDLRKPLSTVSSTGAQQQLVAASAVAFYGSEADGQDVGTPARTVTAKARMGLVQSALAHSLTPAQLAGARRVAKFLRAHGVQFDGEFATVAGHVIIDIGMRMLTPRELFRAQGFDDDYIIDRAWIADKATGEVREVKLTKEQQIRMCGNSLCPQVLEAIVRANCPDLIQHDPPPKWRPTFAEYQQRRIAA